MYDNNCDDASEVILDHPFTLEQEECLQRRYREGFDLTIDLDYIQWLKANHPESGLLDGQTGVAHSSNRTCDTTHTSDQEQGDTKDTLLDNGLHTRCL